jgi:hypothetical protein
VHPPTGQRLVIIWHRLLPVTQACVLVMDAGGDVCVAGRSSTSATKYLRWGLPMGWLDIDTALGDGIDRPPALR